MRAQHVDYMAPAVFESHGFQSQDRLHSLPEGVERYLAVRAQGLRRLVQSFVEEV